VAACLFGLALVACGVAAASPGRVVATVCSFDGKCEFRRHGIASWQQMRSTELVLGAADQVRTGKTGHCVLIISGTRVSVGPNSVVQMPSEPPHDGLWHRLRVIVGKAVIRIFGDRESDIITPATNAAASGTAFEVDVDPDGTTTVTVAEGTVRVFNAAGEVRLSANQQTRVVTGGAPAAPVVVDAQQIMMWEADLTSLPLTPEIRLAPEEPLEGLPARADQARTQAQQKSDDPQAQMSAAALLHDAGRYEQAEEAARRATELAPGDARAAATLALALLGEGNAADAKAAADKAPAGAWRNLASGLIALRTGGDEQVKQAAALLQQAAGELPEANVHLALADMRLGKADEASQAIDAALQARPKDCRALALKSMLLLSKGDKDGAAEAAEAALAAEPKSATAHEARAEVAFFSGDPALAQQHIDQALDLAPNSASAHALAADIYAANDDLTAAMAEAQRAVALDPSLAPAWRVLGVTYAAQGAYPRAAKAMQRTIELQPRMVSAYSTLGVVYSRQGKAARALDQLQIALSLGSSSAQLENDLGALLVNIGRTDEGIEHLQRAIELGEKAGSPSAMPYANLAIAYLDLNRFAEAETAAQTALKLGARSAAVHTVAARVYITQNRNRLAEAELREALEINPNYALARVKLAALYHLNGQDREAAKETLRGGLTDAHAITEERFFSRTEVSAQAGSWQARIKTDGMFSEGRGAYFGSIVGDHEPMWRPNSDLDAWDGQFLAGYLTDAGNRDFLRLIHDRVNNGRPGSIFDPDPNYRTRARQTSVEIARNHWANDRTSLTALAHYQKVGFIASNPDSKKPDGKGGVLDTRWYLSHEVEEPRWGLELRGLRDLGRGRQVIVGAAGEWGDVNIHDMLWQVVPVPGNGVVAGHMPFDTSMHVATGTGYLELQCVRPGSVINVGGLVAVANGASPIWRPRAAWRKTMKPDEHIWISTYPILRDDVSWLSPTDPWRMDHGLENINFASGGFGQFYEARYQRLSPSGSLLGFVAFYRTFDGLLVLVANPQWEPEGGYYPLDRGHAYGAQLSEEFPVSPRLTLAAETTWTQSNDDSNDREIPYTPRWAGNLSAHYKDASGWRVAAVWRVVGSREHRFAGGSPLRLGSYNTLDARISRQLNPAWNVFVAGTNLMNRDYDVWYGFPENGRHVVVGVERRW
jgi:tetratricopeptide (TPR) repeat protein